MATESDKAEEPRWPQWTRGDRLRKSRELAGLNQEAMGVLLADLNGGEPFKHSTIAAWERDRSQPRDLVAIIQRWAEITRVDAAWLLDLGGRRESSLCEHQGSNYVSVPYSGQMELFGDAIIPPSLELVKT